MQIIGLGNYPYAGFRSLRARDNPTDVIGVNRDIRGCADGCIAAKGHGETRRRYCQLCLHI